MTRSERLCDAGRRLAGWRAAVAWTMGNTGDLAKRCGTGWDRVEPLPEAGFAAGLFAQRGTTKNPCVVLRASGLIGVETDSDDDLRAYMELGLPETASVRSSGPGKMHFYFRPPPGVYPSHFGFRFEYDGRTQQHRVHADTGRYFVCPPAIHPSGVEYEWANDLEPATLTPEQYGALMSAARQSVETEARDLARADARVAEGNRRMALYSLARACAFRGVPHDAILEMALAWNASRCDPPLDRRQVEEHVAGALSRYTTQMADELGAPSPDDYQPEAVRLSASLRSARDMPSDDGIAFPTPDYVIARLRPSTVTFLGGYPGDGKSSVALQCVIANPDKRALIFTYEMSKELLAQRAAKIVGVDWRDPASDEAFANTEVYLANEREDLLGVVERTGPYDLVVIDHLHLLGYDDRRVLERWAGSFKEWAMALNIPFLVLAQLRGTYDFARPKQSSFRDSAMISATADTEMYVWRERDSNGQRTDAAEIIIHKDRIDGHERTEQLRWDGEHLCFRPRHVPLSAGTATPAEDLAPFEDGGSWDDVTATYAEGGDGWR